MIKLFLLTLAFFVQSSLAQYAGTKPFVGCSGTIKAEAFESADGFGKFHNKSKQLSSQFVYFEPYKPGLLTAIVLLNDQDGHQPYSVEVYLNANDQNNPALQIASVVLANRNGNVIPPSGRGFTPTVDGVLTGFRLSRRVKASESCGHFEDCDTRDVTENFSINCSLKFQTSNGTDLGGRSQGSVTFSGARP